MKRKQTEERVRVAADKITPDSYTQILSACGWEQDERDMEIPAAGKRRKHIYRRYGSVVLAAAVLLAINLTGIRYYLGGSTRISLDVNPSILLQINRLNRVTRAEALNEEGKALLEEMKLKGTDIHGAVDALVGAMLKAGYLSETENSVLLSILDEKEARGEKLQQELALSARQAFDSVQMEGAVISQNLSGDETQFQKLAEEYHVSEGKAALAFAVASQNTSMSAAEIAKLSVHDINLLVHSKGLDLGNAQSYGVASSEGYIGEEKAKELAFEFCGKEPEEVHHILASMDYSNGRVTYEVEFYQGEYKYEYEMDAADGDMLEWEAEWKRADLLEEELKELEREAEIQGIGEEQALSIAIEDAGVKKEDIVFCKVLPDYEQRECFEVEFNTAEKEYEYKIDADTGMIVEYTYGNAE